MPMIHATGTKEDAERALELHRAYRGKIQTSAIQGMAGNPIVFACANPVPEIWPSQALEAGARIVATGRSDFPSQVNNSLVFPGLFRGVFDVRASSISDGMARAAARALPGEAATAAFAAPLLPAIH